jgi:hypothetical protein
MSELEQATEHLKAAAAIVDAHLLKPVDAGEAKTMRRELLRRLQASEQVSDAILWVSRLSEPLPTSIAGSVIAVRPKLMQ